MVHGKQDLDKADRDVCRRKSILNDVIPMVVVIRRKWVLSRNAHLTRAVHVFIIGWKML